MDHLKDKTVLVADWGLFTELASRLARDFGRVWYFMPWASAYPRSAAAAVGTGIDGVERVLTFWDYAQKADIVVFPDIYFADWQEVVRDVLGKPVWGHGQAEALELDRAGTRRLQRDLGIKAPKTKVIRGIEALRRYLQNARDAWVKISAFRGDTETWQAQTWHIAETYLNFLEQRIGPVAGDYEFVVEQNVEGVEVGYDGWTVMGEYPEAAYWGFEVKALGYVGKFSPYEEIPGCVRDINERLAPILAESRSVGFCSFEFRYNGADEPYMIDPCMRCGSPPFEALQEAYTNVSEIIWEGAHGRMMAPEALGKYIAMGMMHSDMAAHSWVPIDCPKKDRRWLKLRNACVVGGKLYHAPLSDTTTEIGAVVGVADTLEEAVALAKERGERIKGYDVDVRTESLDDAQEVIEEAAKYGIEF